jgi:hypothetical protein
MPAKRPPIKPVSYVEAALTDIPMTDAMNAMATVSGAKNDLDAVLKTLDELVNDCAEIAWGEQQQVQHILAAQGRPFTHRTSFRDKLMRRGFTTNIGYNAHRNRDPIVAQPVADYLLDPELAEIREEARQLRKRMERHAAARAQQYPAQHQRLLALVEERASQIDEAS